MVRECPDLWPDDLEDMCRDIADAARMGTLPKYDGYRRGWIGVDGTVYGFKIEERSRAIDDAVAMMKTRNGWS